MKLIPDLFALVGLGLLGYGLSLIYVPAAFCVVGVLLLAFGLLLSRSQAGVDHAE